ncbi:MAG: tyrosine-protein phosphatase [Vicinamibacteria bacterium]
MSAKGVAAWVLLAGLCLGLLFSAPSILGDNFRSVVPGRVYRSGQLSAAELEERIEKHGLRSVVNLRGEKENREWYRRELEVVRRHGIELRNLDLVPERLPSRPAVAALIDHLETLPEPILIHCSAGADRTGFASVIARMAKDDSPFDEARTELSFWYGHLPFGPAAEIGRIFDQYDSYRRDSRADESWEAFELWAREIYVPYVYSARLTSISLPSEASPGQRLEVRLRIANTSPDRWVFTSDPSRGIKLGVRLRERGEGRFRDYDRHAQFDRSLEAGGELELTAPISAPRVPGEYEIKLDMVDEHVTWFEDQGSEPLIFPLLVRESETKPALERQSARRLHERRLPERLAASNVLARLERLVEEVEGVERESEPASPQGELSLQA